jgi:helix-turn-helix protein
MHVMSNSQVDDTSLRATNARKGSPFLRSKEAAFYLGLKPHTLIRMRMRGVGPKFRRHGRHIFYHIDELDAWSQSH